MPANPMRFIQGPPTFAIDVRSENDSTPSAELEMASKRADYFQAGTVVWDVDPIQGMIRKYASDSAGQPVVFSRGQEADAEPAVPGWCMAVDRIFAT